jgi:hypothetical protein
MEVYNKETRKIVNFICVINGEDISRDVIDNFVIDDSHNFDKYTYFINNNGEICYEMDSVDINYWYKVFTLLKEIELFKDEIENKFEDLYLNLNSKNLWKWIRKYIKNKKLYELSDEAMRQFDKILPI